MEQTSPIQLLLQKPPSPNPGKNNVASNAFGLNISLPNFSKILHGGQMTIKHLRLPKPHGFVGEDRSLWGRLSDGDDPL